MAFWLFKTEPGTFSWDDQVRAWPKRRGMERCPERAPRKKHMRAMKVGDLGFFYHSVDEKKHRGSGEDRLRDSSGLNR